MAGDAQVAAAIKVLFALGAGYLSGLSSSTPRRIATCGQREPALAP